MGAIQMRASVNETIDIPGGVAVLAPGTQLAVVGTINQTPIRVFFSGYTRLAEASELSF